ncbi:hypothetical protein [Mesorhizobium sp. CAU 1732]|uniref:hypothetical protein n=1 Tax=Mesorhizobium sp. CAU 1732 TaxID=3140358 RepID=UPI0032614779
MSETKAKQMRERALTKVIRKEIGSDTNRRMLARIPAFKPTMDVPDEFVALLGELDRAERRNRGRRQ